MEREPRTLEEIQATIRAARDSVWVINSTIASLNEGKLANASRKSDIDRNVSHLKLVVADPEILASGQDIGDLFTAIEEGEAKLGEDIWSA